MTPFVEDVVIDNVERYLEQRYAERTPVAPLHEDAMPTQWLVDGVVLVVIVAAWFAGWLTAWVIK